MRMTLHHVVRGLVLAAVLLTLTAVRVCNAVETSNEKRITAVFRFDDYSELSDTAMEVKLINAFREHGICCTFGIIPFVCTESMHSTRDQDLASLSAAKGDILRDAIAAGAVEPALHGYAHQTIREAGGWTEFAGLDLGEQLAKIRKGRDHLEQVLDSRVTIFVPPWNSYDDSTARSLEQLGFACISAATFGECGASSSVKYLPYTCDLLDLRRAINAARRGPDAAPIIVTLFHSYDFDEADGAQGALKYQDFLGLLDWVTSQQDVDVRSMSEVMDIETDLGGHRLAANGALGIWPLYIPPFMADLVGMPTGVYLSTRAAENMKNTKHLLYAGTVLFYLLVALVPAIAIIVIGRAIPAPFATVMTVSKFLALAVLLAALACASRNLQLGYKEALVISGLSGVTVGIWANAWKGVRRRLPAPTAPPGEPIEGRC